MSKEIEVSGSRSATAKDDGLMALIAEMLEASKEFDLKRFELGYDEDGNPAIRSYIQISLADRVVTKVPCFLPIPLFPLFFPR